jgi:hypothetical protein
MRNPLATLDAVRLDDPAIDTDRSNLDLYEKTLNLGHLAFKDGQKPVIFKVQQPSSAFTLDVLERISGSGRLMYAFQACVHEILLPDGNRLLIQKEHATKSVVGGMTVAHEMWLDQVRAKYGANTILRMGAIACRLGTLSDSEFAGFTSPVG